jgi:hypothetical protein
MNPCNGMDAFKESILRALSPLIVVHGLPEVEEICSTSNLTLKELLQPFCRKKQIKREEKEKLHELDESHESMRLEYLADSRVLSEEAAEKELSSVIQMEHSRHG